jgi:hypothetical protein
VLRRCGLQAAAYERGQSKTKHRCSGSEGARSCVCATAPVHLIAIWVSCMRSTRPKSGSAQAGCSGSSTHNGRHRDRELAASVLPGSAFPYLGSAQPARGPDAMVARKPSAEPFAEPHTSGSRCSMASESAAVLYLRPRRSSAGACTHKPHELPTTQPQVIVVMWGCWTVQDTAAPQTQTIQTLLRMQAVHLAFRGAHACCTCIRMCRKVPLASWTTCR